jgi:predicted permease
MIDDLRGAVRALGRSKALTAVLLVSLALGTGANAAVSGVVHALLLSDPPGVEGAGDLVSIFTSEFGGHRFGRSSHPDVLSVSALPLAREVAAYDDSRFANVRLGALTRRVRIVAVSQSYFSVLRMRPHTGRLLSGSGSPAGPPPAVISVTLAQTAGEPADLIGQILRIGQDAFTVVGIAPPKFRGLNRSRIADVWVPMSAGDSAGDRGERRLAVVARPRTDATALQAQLDALSVQLAAAHPDTNRGAVTDPDAPRALSAFPYSPDEPGSGPGMRLLAGVVLGALALLLASACVNAATLLLSRAVARRREVAVKMALGATRLQLVRQLFAESLVVSLAGGTLGLLFAVWTTASLPALFAPEHADLLDTSLSPLLVSLTIGVSLVAGVLFGIAPAVHGTGAPAALALRADSGGVSEQQGGSGTRAVLIVAQLALSTMLLAATGLLMATLTRALDATSGADARRLAVLSIESPGGTCSSPDPLRGMRFQRALAEALPKTTGVEAVGWAATTPLGSHVVRAYAVQAGALLYDPAELDVNVVTPGYFDALGIALVEGRFFDEADGTRAQPVAIVDEILARRRFGVAAVGQHLMDAEGRAVRIVGVVRTARYRTLQDEPQPTVYRPLRQDYTHCGHLFVRTAGEAAPLLPAIGRALERIDAGVTIARAVTLDHHLSEALVVDRLTTRIVGLCGLIALIMSVIGVYGAMNDTVRRRTREIGLRLALGAGPAQVVRLVGAETLSLSGAGILLGVAGTFALERLAAALADGRLRVDAATLIQMPGVLAVVVLVAAAVPLRRALAVNPTIALRAE